MEGGRESLEVFPSPTHTERGRGLDSHHNHLKHSSDGCLSALCSLLSRNQSQQRQNQHIWDVGLFCVPISLHQFSGKQGKPCSQSDQSPSTTRGHIFTNTQLVKCWELLRELFISPNSHGNKISGCFNNLICTSPYNCFSLGNTSSTLLLLLSSTLGSPSFGQTPWAPPLSHSHQRIASRAKLNDPCGSPSTQVAPGAPSCLQPTLPAKAWVPISFMQSQPSRLPAR